MDDKEIEQRYYTTKKNNRALTYEEVKDPEYDYWGRARYWYFHQALCLLAGLMPVDKRAFSCFANSTSPLYYLMLLRYYPIREQDVVLLKNLLKLLKPAIEGGSIPAKKDGEGEWLLAPLHVLEWASQVDGLSVSEKLVDVVHKRGPVKQLTIPDTFLDECYPFALEDLEKIKKNANSPLNLLSKGIPIQGFVQWPIMSEQTQNTGQGEKSAKTPKKLRPDQQHRVEFQALAKKIVDAAPQIEYQDIMEHPNIIDFFKRCVDCEGNLKEYAPKTTQNWFRKVKTLKSGRPRKKNCELKTSRHTLKPPARA